MLQITKIILTCIAYITEESDLVKQGLLNCVPIALRKEKIDIQTMQSQFNDRLILFTFELKKRKANQTISYIGTKMNEKNKHYLARKLIDRTDFGEKSFFFRLNKFKAVHDELEATEGSDVIKVELKYAAYTQEQNTVENLKETLKHVGIIQ